MSLAVGAAVLDVQVCAGDGTDASPNPQGLQCSIDVTKRYGDIWGFVANANKGNALLVGPSLPVCSTLAHLQHATDVSGATAGR